MLGVSWAGCYGGGNCGGNIGELMRCWELVGQVVTKVVIAGVI